MRFKTRRLTLILLAHFRRGFISGCHKWIFRLAQGHCCCKVCSPHLQFTNIQIICEDNSELSKNAFVVCSSALWSEVTTTDVVTQSMLVGQVTNGDVWMSWWIGIRELSRIMGCMYQVAHYRIHGLLFGALKCLIGRVLIWQKTCPY